MVTEHAAWVGSDYWRGLNGQRIAIVGWSHWKREGEEDVGTIGCISRVVSGEWKIPFFTKIRSYFGYCDNSSFWQRVVLFNYLPSPVGEADQRFSHGTQEQQRIAQERFRRIICEKSPQKVFIFTSRRWAFPPMKDPQRLGPNFPQFLQNTYNIDDFRTAAFFLRHPQGANGDVMRQAVRYILALSNPGDD